MKYSLRSLMVGITLFCVVLGGFMGRVEYLRRMAAFHKQEAQRYAKRIGLPGDGIFQLYGTIMLDFSATREDVDAWQHHSQLVLIFERAKKRPWMPIEKSPP
jgi:hypothetical protein